MRKVLKQRYQLQDVLGRGGSGQVYRGWDLVLKKEWAIKEFPGKQKVDQPEEMNELQALKSVSHPGFPRIVDAFTEEDNTYLVMDFIPGMTLEEYAEKLPLNEMQILGIGIQIAEAVLYLHQFTPVLLYLDLKPSNIMVEENGKIKIVDLGSVMIKGREARISGTPGFASPEQMNLMREGRLLSEQSDIYSLGMVLFSLLQGDCRHLPMIDADRRKGILIRKFNPIISVHTERILEKATRGNPEKRYSSMREMISDMRLAEKNILRIKERPLFNKVAAGNDNCFWHQEKSILCCGGRKAMYISKILLLLLVCLCLPPALESLAGEKSKNQKLEVIIRDKRMRKVLVKKGEAYELKENLLLEIPWDNFESGEYQIIVRCMEKGRSREDFMMNCLLETTP